MAAPNLRRSRGQPVCGLVHLPTARRQGLADLEDVPRRPVGHGFSPNLSADAALMARAAVLILALG